MFITSRRFGIVASLGLAFFGVLAVCLAAQSLAQVVDSSQNSTSIPTEAAVAAPAVASLHNPTLDNHVWYEFDKRYQGAYPDASWLPDDDIPGGLQDWRLWFLDGTALIESDPEAVYAHFDEGVQMRPYDWGKSNRQVAGLYQVIPNATPCYVYEFQMYGQARPEDPFDNRDAVLKVGIDRVGWHPNSAVDPAVHGDFPNTTVWGASANNKWAYGPLTVSAEALNSTIVVYTFGDAPGGRYHRVLWDTGSLREVAPTTIYDPENPSSPSGTADLKIVTGTESVTVTWTTSVNALGQVFYRQIASSEPAPTTTATLTNTIYLPVVSVSEIPWITAPLNPASTTHHTAILALPSGRSFAVIVAARGPSGSQCETWVSETRTFKTAH